MPRTRTFDLDTAVDRAMDLFWEHGYEATSLQDLKSALGLGGGSFYAAFASKDALYQAALQRYRDTMASALLQDLQGDSDFAGTVRQAFLGRLRAAASDPLRRGCLLVNAVGERLPRDTATCDVVRQVQDANRQALAALIAAAQSRGELPGDQDPDDSARFLLVCLNGLLAAAKTDPDLPALTRVLDIALHALQPATDQEPTR